MRASSLRWALTAAAIAAGCVTSTSAHADGPGTPNQPPPSLPPSQPATAPMVEVEPQAQPTQVPTYGAYQKRRRKQGAHWYGWQTLTVDGGTLLGGTVLAGADPKAGALVIIGGYLIGPPIVHFAHGQIGRGFGDLGIRVGAPVVLGTVGYLVFHRDGDLFDSGGAVGLVLGFGLGVLGAIAVDAAVLAYEPREDEDEDASARAVRRHAIRPATMTPMIAPRTEGGVLFGLSGTLN